MENCRKLSFWISNTRLKTFHGNYLPNSQKYLLLAWPSNTGSNVLILTFVNYWEKNWNSVNLPNVLLGIFLSKKSMKGMSLISWKKIIPSLNIYTKGLKWTSNDTRLARDQNFRIKITIFRTSNFMIMDYLPCPCNSLYKIIFGMKILFDFRKNISCTFNDNRGLILMTKYLKNKFLTLIELRTQLVASNVNVTPEHVNFPRNPMHSGITLLLHATHCVHTSMNVRKIKIHLLYLHYIGILSIYTEPVQNKSWFRSFTGSVYQLRRNSRCVIASQ